MDVITGEAVSISEDVKEDGSEEFFAIEDGMALEFLINLVEMFFEVFLGFGWEEVDGDIDDPSEGACEGFYFPGLGLVLGEVNGEAHIRGIFAC